MFRPISYLASSALFLFCAAWMNECAADAKNTSTSIAYGSPPSISDRGEWVIQLLSDRRSLYITDTRTSDGRTIQAPDGCQRILWHRWEARQIVLACMLSNGGTEILQLTPGDGKFKSLIPPDAKVSRHFASALNSYRFADVSLRTPSGEELTLERSEFLKRPAGEVRISFSDGSLVMTAGAPPSISVFSLTPRDRRQGAAVISRTSDGAVYVASGAGRDTLALFRFSPEGGPPTLVSEGATDIKRISINPVTLNPEIIEYDDLSVEHHGLNTTAQSNLSAIREKNWGPFSVIDRSPDDSAWLIRFARKSGVPFWGHFDSRNKVVKEIVLPSDNILPGVSWRTESLRLARSNEPSITGYVHIPDACQREKPCSAVLLLHGGPAQRDSADLDNEAIGLIQSGFAILTVNYRGSSGYGKRFESLDAGEWNRGIPVDVRDFVSTVLRQYPIKQDRMGAIGTSFSGLLVLNLIPAIDQLRCAVVDSAPVDVLDFVNQAIKRTGGKSDLIARVADPTTESGLATIMSMSPVESTGKLRDAWILHMHGDEDSVIDAHNPVEFSKRMSKQNSRYQFVAYPKDGHGLLQSRSDYLERRETFMKRCILEFQKSAEGVPNE